MAEITAAMVKDLREKTGVGMMDCKAALAATNGDMEAAVDWLRAKGLAKAAKKSTRVAAEGLIGVSTTGHKGALVEVNSETDFVARNDKFQVMVGDIARLALEARGDLERLKTLAYPGTAHDVAHYVAEMVATIGENMTVRRTAFLEVEHGVVASYMHNQAAPGMGKIGVLVALDSRGNQEELAQFGRMLAMHIAATNPVALNIDSVPADTLARERAILEEKNHGKPANVMEKIVASGLKSFAKDNTLLEQAYVHDGAKSVSQVIGEMANKLATPVVLKAYVRMQLGEGVEKKEDDFAAEVAKMSGN